MKMSRSIICAAVATAALALVFSAGAVMAAAPKLVTDIESRDFGEVDETVPVKHTFTLTNKGDAPLKITKIESS
jgi:hypothetical protein